MCCFGRTGGRKRRATFQVVSVAIHVWVLSLSLWILLFLWDRFVLCDHPEFWYSSCCFVLSSSGIVSWIIPVELFPPRARAKAASVTTSLRFAATLLSSYVLQRFTAASSTADDDTAINGHTAVWCFIGFGSAAVICGVGLALSLPETKGVVIRDLNLCGLKRKFCRIDDA